MGFDVAETHRWSDWAWLLPAFLLFAIGATTEIDLPGVYMDAVNPDYAVVNLLSRDGPGVFGWFLPGNLLFGRFLVLGGLYHGALPLYLGLPAYALFGTGILGIRLANLLFGLIVLAGAGLFLRRFRVRPAIAGFCLAGLALDPGFVFSFRTQFYITLLPIGLVFASLAIAERACRRGSWPGLLAAGGLAGLSCYGYFIYAFLVPAAFAHVAWRRPGMRLLAAWLAGFALGIAPYVLGFALIAAATGGLGGFIGFMRSALASLEVHSSLTLAQRLSLAAEMIRGTVLDVGPTTMMLRAALPAFSPALKLALLLGLPGLALLLSWLTRRPSAGLHLALGLLAGFVALVASFGSRLWLHHAALLLPVLYVGLALALDWLGRRAPAWRFVLPLAALPLLYVNAADAQAIFQRLRATGGVGLASSALTAMAEDAVRIPRPSRYFFPDWGVFMSFAMITRGGIPYSAEFTPAAARQASCAGTDAVAVLTGDNPAARIEAWSAEIGGPAPALVEYRQRDGVLALTAARWPARPCP